MLLVPENNEFRWHLHSHPTTRPAAAFGTLVTASASANTKGSYANVITTATEYDSYYIVININSGATSTAVKNYLVDIGIDEAGGTSYTVKIPDLYACDASPYTVGGVWYSFPLFIKAGSTIGARTQCDTGSATAYVNIQLFGQPTNPDIIKCGSYVEALGVDTSQSRGTSITMGTTSEGAWTSVGSPTNNLWFWQAGYGVNDASISLAVIDIDVSAGDVTNKKELIYNMLVTCTSTEQITKLPYTLGCVGYVDESETVYTRAQSSAASDTLPMIAVYGLGG
jgi:hypothetical protein